MQIPDIDVALGECEAIIVGSKAQGTRLETYLVGYMLVYMSACFQAEIRKIVEQQLSLNAADLRIRNYIDRSLARHFQSVQTSNMAKLLDFFGEQRRKSFNKSLTKTPLARQASTLYQNIITNRHLTAHTSGTQMTFNDLKTAYTKGHVVLDYFLAAIS